MPPQSPLGSGSKGAGSASSRLLRISLASLLAVLGFFGGTPMSAQSLPPLLPSPPVHIKRYNPGGAVSPKGTPTCSSPQLSYYDGPIISNVYVVPVFWNSNVNASIVENIGQFFSDATVSNWYDLLSEYSSVGGTGQSIGRGTSDAGITITPSLCNASIIATCELTDAELQTELTAQINASVLPLPQGDLAGNVNTVYMVFFPPNISLSIDSVKSCANGGFCAYHSTGTYGTANTPLPYGAIMDEFSGGCSTGCGSSSTVLENMTSTTSHELAESVTDTDIGLFTADSLAAPVAWYDGNNSCGEVADICDNGTSGYTITVSGRTWAVQQLWSNALGACVTTGLHPVYQINAPTTVVAGTQFDFSLAVTDPSGSKGTDIAYVGTVSFGSSDPQATLPANYIYAHNQGSLNFSATLSTLGVETITATDLANSAITATATVNVFGPATLTTPTPKSTLGTTNVTFTWSAGVGVTEYELRLGTTGAGSLNLYNSGDIMAKTVTVPNIPATGATINARLYSMIDGVWEFNDYTYMESAPAALLTPMPGGTLGTANVTFTWSAGGGVTEYELRLGTTGAGSLNLYNSGDITAKTVTVPSIPVTGATINARLYSMIGGVWEFNDYTYMESAPAALLTPTPGGTLGTTNVAFTWNSGTNVTEYELRLGTTGAGSLNLYNSGDITAKTVTVPSIPVTGATVNARLYSNIGGVWEFNDYTYMESAPAALLTPMPGGTLGTTNVTFTWSSGTNVTEYELRLGTTGAGSLNLYNSGDITAKTVTVPSIPANGATVNARLYSMIGGVWHYVDYTYTEP